MAKNTNYDILDEILKKADDGEELTTEEFAIANDSFRRQDAEIKRLLDEKRDSDAKKYSKW